MNQLQNLLHDALISTQHVEKCALLNKEDYSVKAASIGFQVPLEIRYDGDSTVNQ
jgi:profilin